MSPAILPISEEEFAKQVSDLLKRAGWFHNGGWRRVEDARMAVAMPPALSAGEAVDETFARARRTGVHA